MACENGCEQNRRRDQNRCLLESLKDNVNSVVVVYTEGGCFSGLLVSVCDECIKIITSAFRSGCRSCCGNEFGKITVIPIDKITAVTFCNTGF